MPLFLLIIHRIALFLPYNYTISLMFGTHSDQLDSVEYNTEIMRILNFLEDRAIYVNQQINILT
jgi:hypothetical protein